MGDAYRLEAVIGMGYDLARLVIDHQMPSWFSRDALSSRPRGNAHDLDMISVAEADRAMVRVF